MEKWKCLVCGYIHTGDAPTEKCPVCGVGASKFEKMTEASITEKSTRKKPAEETDKSGGVYGSLVNFILKHHIHPISIHSVNGLLPASVIFVFIAVVFELPQFQTAAFYNSVFVLLNMPIVLFSGYIENKERYSASRTKAFLIKKACGIVVFAILIIVVVWFFLNPEVASPDSPTRWFFLLAHLIMLVAAGIAGHIGGKLVFAGRDSESNISQ